MGGRAGNMRNLLQPCPVRRVGEEDSPVGTTGADAVNRVGFCRLGTGQGERDARPLLTMCVIARQKSNGFGRTWRAALSPRQPRPRPAPAPPVLGPLVTMRGLGRSQSPRRSR